MSNNTSKYLLNKLKLPVDIVSEDEYKTIFTYKNSKFTVSKFSNKIPYSVLSIDGISMYNLYKDTFRKSQPFTSLTKALIRSVNSLDYYKSEHDKLYSLPISNLIDKLKLLYKQQKILNLCFMYDNIEIFTNEKRININLEKKKDKINYRIFINSITPVKETGSVGVLEKFLFDNLF